MTPEQQVPKTEVLNIEDYEKEHLAPSKEVQEKLRKAGFGHGYNSIYFVPDTNEKEGEHDT
jgi:hypothetical protein